MLLQVVALALALSGGSARLAPRRCVSQLALRGGGDDADKDHDVVKHPKTLSDLISMANDTERLVVVDFGAKWCERIAPIFVAMAAEMPETVFVKVDIDEVAEAAEHYGVTALPTFVVVKNGVELSRFSGADEDTLRKTVEEAAATQ